MLPPIQTLGEPLKTPQSATQCDLEPYIRSWRETNAPSETEEGSISAPLKQFSYHPTTNLPSALNLQDVTTIDLY